MNNKGQLTVEYLLLIMVILIIIISITSVTIYQSEKNIILTSAQNGAQEGADKNNYAMYANNTDSEDNYDTYAFNKYEEEYPRLLSPVDVKIIKINEYEKNETITLVITATSKSTLTSKEKEMIGDRINYYSRKSVTEAFNKNKTNLFYDPALSNNYKIKTDNVIWL